MSLICHKSCSRSSVGKGRLAVPGSHSTGRVLADVTCQLVAASVCCLSAELYPDEISAATPRLSVGPTAGVFGLVTVGACEVQARLHVGEDPAQGSGSPSKTRCFWPIAVGVCHGFRWTELLLRVQGLHADRGVFSLFIREHAGPKHCF